MTLSVVKLMQHRERKNLIVDQCLSRPIITASAWKCWWKSLKTEARLDSLGPKFVTATFLIRSISATHSITTFDATASHSCHECCAACILSSQRTEDKPRLSVIRWVPSLPGSIQTLQNWRDLSDWCSRSEAFSVCIFMSVYSPIILSSSCAAT
jgi:hypothetical protein